MGRKSRLAGNERVQLGGRNLHLSLCEHPFTSGIYNGGMRLVIDTGSWGCRAAYNLMGQGDANYIGVISCGARGSFADAFTCTVDA